MNWLGVFIVLMLGCHAQTQSKVSLCMEDDSQLEYDRCSLKIEAGDYDGNGVIDWHDSYLYDHCENICPDCCVKIDKTEVQYGSIESAIHCPPQECPGKKCLCILGEGNVWYLSPEVGDDN